MGTIELPDSEDPWGPAEDQLLHEVASTIAEYRGGAGAGDIAQTIVEKEKHSLQLLGLVDDAEAVEYWFETMSNVRRYPAEVLRKMYGSGETVEYAIRLHDVREYVRTQDEGHFDWLHPRWRWLREND